MKRKRPSTFQCPHCGGTVRSTAVACPHCGSDEETGWAEEDAAEYEEDDFDYDDYIQREFPQHSEQPEWSWKKSWVKIVALLLLLTMLFSLLLAF